MTSNPKSTISRPPDAGSKGASTLYLRLLTWCFVFFSSTRLLTYLPTLWAIHHSGDSSQHSLLTWAAWVGSNSVMAAWLYEHNGQQMNRAIAVTTSNAVMCGLACVLIVYHR